MRIRKTFQGEIPENKIINMQSDSQTDAYSCAYLNNMIGDSAIEIGLTARYDYTAVGWQVTPINYNYTNVQIGSKLTRNGNKVVIGAGVSRVLCIGVGNDFNQSGSGYEHDSGFRKNQNDNYSFGWSYEASNGGLDTHTIAAIIDVSQGDTIQHCYNTGGTPTFTVFEKSHLIVIALK